MTTQTVQPWELDWTFGDRIRKARRVLGLTIDELATKLEVSKQAVSQWETGATTPRSVNAVARRLELAYGIPATWTLGVETPPPGPDGGEWAHRGSNSEPAGSTLRPVSVLFDSPEPADEIAA